MKNRLNNQKNMLYKLLCSIEKPNAQVAQSVEQRTENPRVGGSIPSPSTIKNHPQGWFFYLNAFLH